jgi:alpha-galactosidase
MKLSLTPSGALNIESDIVSLRDARPVVNGQIVEGAAEVIQNDAAGRVVRYTGLALGHGALVVEAHPEAENSCAWLRYWVEGLEPQFTLDSFGLQFAALENLRAYLRSGYFSWDGSAYVVPEALADFEPGETRPEVGYALTQLLPRFGAGSLTLGFDQHERFQHTFTFHTQLCPVALTILTLWDRKERVGLSRCESEKLLLFEHAEVEAALRAWARRVAAASSVPPRLCQPPITGWCSWYNLYTYMDEGVILEHLRGAAAVVQREELPLRVFQIDDGFTPEMGDWLEVKPQFPRGMQPLLAEIGRAGFVPGLWIAPFMVGNRSHLYRDHPDWVVRDRSTGEPLKQWEHAGEYRWHKRSEEYYILDTTQPEAFAYLRRVFRTWRQDWGCGYFKTDFMQFGSEHGPDRAVWHTPGLTRIEIWRRTASMIRDEIGNALWVGCGCPLWASVGLVDGVRVASDVGVEWTGGLSPQSLLRDLASRNFANHILWQLDPDSVLLREHFHALTEVEVRSLAIYAGVSGGILMTGDALDELTPGRLRLLKLILGETRATCRFPMLEQSALIYEPLAANVHPRTIRHQPRPVDPVLVQVRCPSYDGKTGRGEHAELETAAVFLFNTGNYHVQRTYPLATLGLAGPRHVFDWTLNQAWPIAVDRLSVTLPPHDGRLLFLSRVPILEPPPRLP